MSVGHMFMRMTLFIDWLS